MGEEFKTTLKLVYEKLFENYIKIMKAMEIGLKLP
jgi:hypothetical protein